MRVTSFALACLLAAFACQSSPSTSTSPPSPPSASPQPPIAPSPDHQEPSPDETRPAELGPTKLVGSGVPNGDPPADALRCSIRDSNGPLPGGESTASGCPEDASCACGAQAGYSCSGACVRDGAWVLQGS